ncbi:cytoskeleton-associated protein 2 isoform X2 [Amia ocellicauda]|uniref:cytoskeleton-associated protein 2 isoform X2 n=1 Tax=Amia ocellicauda TaxID=2972642 RepID=UPI0034640A81
MDLRRKDNVQINSNVSNKTSTKLKNKENTKPGIQPSEPVLTKAPVKKQTPSTLLLPADGKKGVVLTSVDGKCSEGQQAPAGVPERGINVKRRTLSRSFLTHKKFEQKKLIVEATKASTNLPHKPVLGSYKGKTVQSKISSFRQPMHRAAECEEHGDVKGMVPKSVGHRPGVNPVVSRPSTLKPSVTLPAKPAAAHRSVAHRLASAGPVPKQNHRGVQCSAVASRPVASSTTARTMSHVAQPKLNPVLKKSDPPQKEKSREPSETSSVKGVRVAISSQSQYRVSKETQEERRAKLAEWLASKGKTLKRPSMALLGPRTLKLIPKKEPEPHAPHNTTMDLEDNQEQDLPVDPVAKTEEDVMNLCCTLETMVLPSKSESDAPGKGENMEMDCKKEEDVKVESGTEGEDLCKKIPSLNSGQQSLKKESGWDLDQESDEAKTSKDDSPSISVAIKYSVTTTPYLQSAACGKHENSTEKSWSPCMDSQPVSVKKMIQGDGSKIAIKDLKFLTPVRRSCRIQRQSARLPNMLADHDPCVTSLGELVCLDGDANAYIYRSNPALQAVKSLPQHAESPGSFKLADI